MDDSDEFKARARKTGEPELVVGDRLPFGELAMLLGYIGREDLGQALRDQVLKNQKIGTILIQNGAMTKEQAKEVLRLQRREGPILGYQLQQRIGSGGMGTVYKAVQKSLNRTVAIKVLNLEGTQNDVQRKRFIQEAHLLAQLHHPNLVQCIDVGESEGLVYLVLEYIEGRNARERLNHMGPYPEALVFSLMEQCLDAICHYHSKAIIHRDLKPENLLITADDQAKITDLGLSKQLTNDLYLTRTGKTVGTPYYISPELARGETAIDIRSDLYSLGATFYHLVTGRPVFEGASSAEILTRHVKDPPLAPSKILDTISPAMDELLLTLLEKTPKRRYESPEAALEALRQLGGETLSQHRRRSTTGAAPMNPRASSSRNPVKSSGTRASPRASSSVPRTSGATPRSSSTRPRAGSAATRGRMAALNPAKSGASRRLDRGRPGEPQGNSKVGIIVAVLLVLAVALAVGYRLGQQSSPTPPSQNSEEARFERERRDLLLLCEQDPRLAVAELDRFTDVTARPDESRLRWLLLQERFGSKVSGDVRRNIEVGLERATQALEKQAGEAMSRLEDDVTRLLDANNFKDARAQIDAFPKRFQDTSVWQNLKELREHVMRVEEERKKPGG